jgi:hypothetical protein
MTYHDEHDPELHPEDVPYERNFWQPVIAAAVVIVVGLGFVEGTRLLMNIVRWVTA